MGRRSRPAGRRWRARGERVRSHPDRYELHFEDETHIETNPYLCRVWHRRGVQPTVPAAGTNRRLTVFGSVAADGRGRVEVIQARQDSTGFDAYLAALEQRHRTTGRAIILALDNGPAHTSQQSQAALAARADWLEVIWLARYSPELNPKEREWKQLKHDVRSHLAADLPTFVAEVRAGLERLGGTECTVVDLVPEWWLAGHRKPPTGRPRGRPKGAKDTLPRQRRVADLPAST